MAFKVVHLSDLHITPAREHQRVLFDSLVAALAAEVERGAVDLVAATGDIFDSCTLPVAAALEAFGGLLAGVRGALGEHVPVLVLPGNHDRRDAGVFGPYRGDLMTALREAVQEPSVRVFGCETPFLAESAPEEISSRLPFELVAYDSTYLPVGWVSAGGLLRGEDILQVAARLEDVPPDRPLVLLAHHHLVPTPVTDVSAIDLSGRGIVSSFVVRKLLPRLIANADREELTMTALGAGTALTALHALGRPVIVLHGHKHYPVVRLVRSPYAGEGDLMLASAGSAGLAEAWQPTELPEKAHLWPSFNVMTFEEGGLDIEVVAFSPKDAEARRSRRPLASARQQGCTWEVAPVEERGRTGGPALEKNLAECTLTRSAHSGEGRWDMTSVRTVTAALPWEDGDYAEIVEGLSDGWLERAGADRQRVPAVVAIPFGAPTEYRLVGGICRTLGAAGKAYGPGAAFEWVGLLNRYESALASLVVSGLPNGAAAFGSVTDLASARERPWRLAADEGRLTLECRDCPARTLLRIYWPLEET